MAQLTQMEAKCAKSDKSDKANIINKKLKILNIMKKINFKWLLLSIVLSIASINIVMAVNCSLGQAYLKCNFNGAAKDFTGSGGYEYVYNTDSHSAFDLGTLSSNSFTITYLSWHCWNDWGSNEYTENFFWYYVNSGGTTTRQQNWDGNGDFYPKQEDITVTIANSTDASGSYTFHHGWYTKFYECCGSSSYTQKDLNNGGSFQFTFKIAPPAVKNFNVTEANHLSGTGTELDPYVLPYNGTLSLSISGSQEHSDANSSAQYYNTSSADAWSATSTKSIGSVTSTTPASVTVKMRYHNGTASLDGAESSATIWYRSEARHNVTVASAGNGTVSPNGTVAVNQQSGTSISTSPSSNYVFDHWTATGGGVSPTSSTTTPQSFTATTTGGSITAYFADKWAIKGGDGDSDDGDGDEMGDWATHNGMPSTGVANTFSTTLSLAANTTYKFKVIERANDGTDKTWYGKSSTTFSRGGTTSVTGLVSTDGSTYNMALRTDVAGNYTITYVYNASAGSMQVSVGFPEAYNVTAVASPVGKGTVTPSSATLYSTANGGSITASAGTGYTFDEWSVTSGSGTIANSKSTTTNFKPSAAATVTATFTANEYDISYLDKGGSAYSGSNSSSLPTTHIYDAATALVNGEKTGYVFEGWYNNSTCTGEPITSLGATAYTADITLYALWTAAADYADDCWDGSGEFNCGDGSEFNTPKSATSANWDEAEWGNDAEPTIETQVVIPAAMAMTIPSGTTAKAKEVVLSEGATLTIATGGALIVASTIDKNGSSTSSSDLTLSAGDDTHGNAALIWGEEGTTPGAATVDFYSKSHGQAGSTASVNQYIGVPTPTSAYSYGDAWVCKIEYDANIAVWTLMDGSEIMSPWVGYDLILNTTSSGGLCSVSGNLENNSDKELSLQYKDAKTENLLANSWPAPIKISALLTTDFENAEPTIYIFNSTSPAAQAKDETMHMGSYSAYTAGTATEVIPSMQSFSVCATSSGASVTLNYKRLVYDPAVSSFSNSPNYAPRRQERKEMNSLKVNVHDTEGWGDELKAFENTDFSAEFEPGWDGHRLDGSSKAPHLYGLADDGSELAVSCLPTFDNMPIGFRASAKAKTYTLSFKYDGEDELVLRDTKTDIETPINEESTYEFVSESTDNDLRFVVIKKVPQIATGVDNISENSNAQKIMHNGAFYIVREGHIYDATGALVK